MPDIYLTTEQAEQLRRGGSVIVTDENDQPVRIKISA